MYFMNQYFRKVPNRLHGSIEIFNLYFVFCFCKNKIEGSVLSDMCDRTRSYLKIRQRT